jgi:hypothetical protein
VREVTATEIPGVVTTPPGVRNNAKSIFRIPMLAEGFKGRAKWRSRL